MKSVVHAGWKGPSLDARRDSQETTVAGTHGQPLRPGEWLAPKFVELDDAERRIVYRPDDGMRVVTADPGLLGSFIRLADGSADDVRRFASAWGVLELCRHGVPYHHNEAASDPDFDLDNADDLAHLLSDAWKPRGCLPRGWEEHTSPTTYWEPINEWQGFASQVRAIIGCSEDLAGGRLPNPFTCRKALGLGAKEAVPQTQIDLSRHLWATINTWLALGGHARVQMQLGQNVRPEVIVGGPGLFAVIGYMLLKYVARAKEQKVAPDTPLAICFNCGELYVPRRKVRTDRKNYCDDCRAKHAPSKHSKRRTRADAETGSRIYPKTYPKAGGHHQTKVDTTRSKIP